jgi:hypothetical protein
MTSHRGPVCDLAAFRESLLSAGSDGTIRLWAFQKEITLVSKSSHEQVCEIKLCPTAADSANSLGGVRCLASREDTIFAGLETGVLAVLTPKLEVTRTIPDASTSVVSIAVSEWSPLLATGGDGGSVRLYSISTRLVRPIATRLLDSSPIASLVFTRDSVAAASARGVHFSSLSNLEPLALLRLPGVLSMVFVARPRLLAAACRDGRLCLISPSDFRIFRTHALSQTAYPLSVAADPRGLLLVAALSDGAVVGVDAVSGDPAFRFTTLAGVVTRIAFHAGDLAVGSHGGFVMRWELPPALRVELERSPGSPPPLEAEEDEDGGADRIRRSVIGHAEPPPELIYREGRAEAVAEASPDAGEEEDDAEPPDDAPFDGPRPAAAGDGGADAFLRRSFARRAPAERMGQLAERLAVALAGARALLDVPPESAEVRGAQAELRGVLAAAAPTPVDGNAELARRLEGAAGAAERELADAHAAVAAIRALLAGGD